MKKMSVASHEYACTNHLCRKYRYEIGSCIVPVNKNRVVIAPPQFGDDRKIQETEESMNSMISTDVRKKFVLVSFKQRDVPDVLLPESWIYKSLLQTLLAAVANRDVYVRRLRNPPVKGGKVLNWVTVQYSETIALIHAQRTYYPALTASLAISATLF
jgi:hypothetical protein